MVSRPVAILISVGLLLGYYNNLPVWLDNYNNTGFAPKLYLLIVLIAMVLGAVHYRKAIGGLHAAYIQWCIAALVLVATALIRVQFAGMPGQALGSVRDQVEQSIMMLSIGLLVYLTPQVYFRRVLPILAFLVPSVLLFEFFNPDYFTGVRENEADEARVSGFWGNENAAAEVSVLALVLAYKHTGKLTLSLLYSIVFFAILFTGSRAGMVGVSLIGVSLFMQRRFPIIFLAVPVVLALSLTTVVSYVEDLVESTERVQGSENLIERITYFLDDDIEVDESADLRGQVVVNGIENSVQKPVFGHGVRYIDGNLSIGPHNIVIDLFYQFGLFGIILWVWLAILLFRSEEGLTKKLGFFCFVWFSMFTHNILESPWWFVFFALSLAQGDAIVSSGRRLRRRRKSRKKRRKNVVVSKQSVTVSQSV